MADFETLDSHTLILYKMSWIEKSCNFHTVGEEDS